jgi:hypothetical protein
MRAARGLSSFFRRANDEKSYVFIRDSVDLTVGKQSIRACLDVQFRPFDAPAMVAQLCLGERVIGYQWTQAGEGLHIGAHVEGVLLIIYQRQRQPVAGQYLNILKAALQFRPGHWVTPHSRTE